MTSSYRFRTQWRFGGTAAEVRGVLDDVLSLPRWWPSVYLTIVLLEEGGSAGIGRRVRLRTTGWLPYTLTWTSILTQPVTERGFSFRATGDFEGTGEWVFRQDGPEVVLTFRLADRREQADSATKTWLFRPASPPITGGRWRKGTKASSWTCVVAGASHRRQPTMSRRLPDPPSDGCAAARCVLEHPGQRLTAAARLAALPDAIHRPYAPTIRALRRNKT